MSRTSERGLFLVGAAWNFGVAAAMLLAPATMQQAFYGPAIDQGGVGALGAILWKDFAAFVFLFGVGYAIASADPVRHVGLVALGIVGKLGVVVAVIDRRLAGLASDAAFFPAFVDGAFALLFAFCLCRRRAGSAPG